MIVIGHLNQSAANQWSALQIKWCGQFQYHQTAQFIVLGRVMAQVMFCQCKSDIFRCDDLDRLAVILTEGRAQSLMPRNDLIKRRFECIDLKETAQPQPIGDVVSLAGVFHLGEKP